MVFGTSTCGCAFALKKRTLEDVATIGQIGLVTILLGLRAELGNTETLGVSPSPFDGVINCQFAKRQPKQQFLESREFFLGKRFLSELQDLK
jgi:hypothetical protein